MWATTYPLSFLLFLVSGCVLLWGVYIDDKRNGRQCAEQQRRVTDYKAFADSWEAQ